MERTTLSNLRNQQSNQNVDYNTYLTIFSHLSSRFPIDEQVDTDAIEQVARRALECTPIVVGVWNSATSQQGQRRQSA